MSLDPKDLKKFKDYYLNQLHTGASATEAEAKMHASLVAKVFDYKVMAGTIAMNHNSAAQAFADRAAADWTDWPKRHSERTEPSLRQPVVIDEYGTARFRANRVVEYLLEHGGHDMNKLAVLGAEGDWPKADMAQFAQLIGYSVSGFGELSYVSEKTFQRAHRKLEKVRAAKP